MSDTWRPEAFAPDPDVDYDSVDCGRTLLSTVTEGMDLSILTELRAGAA